MAEKQRFKWRPIESNPDAFNKYLQNIGIGGVECVELFGFDDDMLAFIPKPYVALVFCFPDYKKAFELMKPLYDSIKDNDVPPGLFFMNQKISNACGTFSLYHSLANKLDMLEIDGSSPFLKWLEEAKRLSIEDRSFSLATNSALAEAHKTCAIEGETESTDDDKVEHHFIAYMELGGRLYEFDSSQSFPRDCGPTTQDKLLIDAGIICKDLMKKLDNSISCSAIALVKNPT